MAGTCMAGGMHSREHVWQGACMAGGDMQGDMHGKGACVAGEMATSADSAHPYILLECILVNCLL